MAGRARGDLGPVEPAARPAVPRHRDLRGREADELTGSPSRSSCRSQRSGPDDAVTRYRPRVTGRHGREGVPRRRPRLLGQPQRPGVRGVKEKLTERAHVRGHTVNASPEQPQYRITNDDSGRDVAHRPEVLRHGSR
ncbi:DUF2945 domain-containing protein [Micromonospora sp. DT31]|uniref:DUF2945 domain-containing protein n=1 Tax=Micromonospora sp. DT31 TaxID=3393434 RepID=UPI003CF7F98F